MLNRRNYLLGTGSPLVATSRYATAQTNSGSNELRDIFAMEAFFRRFASCMVAI